MVCVTSGHFYELGSVLLPYDSGITFRSWVCVADGLLEIFRGLSFCCYFLLYKGVCACDSYRTTLEYLLPLFYGFQDQTKTLGFFSKHFYLLGIFTRHFPLPSLGLSANKFM